uniref:Uncharacterized protein n=1 Tax=Rhizophora mucronata TaxID=61149 RepID=A0A2P2QPZ7_RHIMU
MTRPGETCIFTRYTFHSN